MASGTVGAGAAAAGGGAVLRATSLSCLARTANTDAPIPKITARPAPITILLVACEFIISESPSMDDGNPFTALASLPP
ncbi:MAG TPA: hypothetical protein VGL28_09785 [Steroidobacteraceae bacterium]